MAAGTNTQIRVKLIVLLSFALFLAGAFWRSETLAKRQEASAPKPPAAANTAKPQATPTPAPAAATPAATPTEPKQEGCTKCHNNIEPMHRYNATGDVFDKLVDGRDAQGLSCTSCHGGNPAAETQKDAHVQPRYPAAWGCKNGECSSHNPERSNTLIAKESREFVRFVNPRSEEHTSELQSR